MKNQFLKFKKTIISNYILYQNNKYNRIITMENIFQKELDNVLFIKKANIEKQKILKGINNDIFNQKTNFSKI